MLKVYGLKNCDTCRKALSFLKAEGIAHSFIDVRADGVSAADIKRFAKSAGYEKLLNKAGTTWRGLGEKDKADVDEKKAVALMEAHPALIKRPVFDMGGEVLLGFGDAVKAALKKTPLKKASGK